jgi:hypothetical protein
LRFVFDGLSYMPAVDVVVGIRSIYPFFFNIIDDELEVWRYIGGLNSTQIEAFHSSTWVLIGHFQM